MPRPPRPLLLLVALAWASAACTGKPPAPAPSPARPGASVRPGGSAAGVPADALAKAVAGRATRAVSGPVVTASIVGKIRLLSDLGAALVSNNGGSVISNNGGGLLSNNGAGIVSDHQGGIVGKIRYRVMAGTPAAEFALADAVVTVHDAAGRMLLGPDGKPIAAFTDKAGAYKLEASLPAEGVVLRVRLWSGGELAAMLPKAPAGAREQAIDTATSLGAAYVLDRFVKGDQKTYDKLPASEAAALRDVIEAARGDLAGTPRYEPAELVGLADGLQAKAPAVARKFEDIKLLLIGQVALGTGRLATEVALPRLAGLRRDVRGRLLMVEHVTGRIREIGPDGRLAMLADQNRGTRVRQNFPGAQAFAEAPDGTLYVADRAKVYRLGLDGVVTTIAGNGATKWDAPPPADGWPALGSPLSPRGLVVSPDGLLHILDQATVQGGGPVRAGLLALGGDGRVRDVGQDLGRFVTDVAYPAGGGLVAATIDETAIVLMRRAADGAVRELARLPRGLDTTLDLALAPDGTAYLSSDADRTLVAVGPDGAVRRLAGAAATEASPVLAPGPIDVAPDGTLYVADEGSAKVHARSATGAWRVAAGATDAITRSGDLTAIALNQPLAVAFDERGGLLFTESGGSALKRFDGTAIVVVAGALPGFAGDGGPARDARMLRPSGVAHRDGVTWVIDEGNNRLRRIGPDGTITTALGAGSAASGGADGNLPRLLAPGQRLPAGQVALRSARAVAVGPDGLPYVALTEAGQVWRLAADGMVELVAGRLDEGGVTARMAATSDDFEGKPADQLPLAYPVGLAFDAVGDLHVADMLGARVWRIAGLGAGAPVAHAVAGVGLPASIAAAMQGPVALDFARRAADQPIASPAGVAFDAAGRCLIGGLGSAIVDSVALNAGIDFFVADRPTYGSSTFGVKPDGRFELVAGRGGRLFTDPDADDALLSPTGLAVSPDGRLAIADAAANLLRIIPAGAY